MFCVNLFRPTVFSNFFSADGVQCKSLVSSIVEKILSHSSDKFFFSASLCVQLKSMMSIIVGKTLSHASDGNF